LSDEAVRVAVATDWDVKPVFHIHVFVESQWMPVGCMDYPAADSNVIVN